MAAQMAALQAKTLAETGIAVPSYYNPSAVNPMKFAEQEKKRKLLWQGKKEGVRKGVDSAFEKLHLFLLISICAKTAQLKYVLKVQKFMKVQNCVEL